MPDTNERMVKAGFAVRSKGADTAWARVMKEGEMLKQISQARVTRL